MPWKGRLFGRGTTRSLGDLWTMAINHLLTVIGFLRGGLSKGGCNWGILRIPREDRGTLGKIRGITTPRNRILLMVINHLQVQGWSSKLKKIIPLIFPNIPQSSQTESLGFPTHLANGPWNKSLNFVCPTKYVFPKSWKSLAIGH